MKFMKCFLRGWVISWLLLEILHLKKFRVSNAPRVSYDWIFSGFNLKQEKNKFWIFGKMFIRKITSHAWRFVIKKGFKKYEKLCGCKKKQKIIIMFQAKMETFSKTLTTSWRYMLTVPLYIFPFIWCQKLSHNNYFIHHKSHVTWWKAFSLQHKIKSQTGAFQFKASVDKREINKKKES